MPREVYGLRLGGRRALQSEVDHRGHGVWAVLSVLKKLKNLLFYCFLLRRTEYGSNKLVFFRVRAYRAAAYIFLFFINELVLIDIKKKKQK